MAKDKLPAFQFYPGDWRKDPGVQALGFFERGIWFEILCLMHESEDRGKLVLNGRPMSDEALANILGLDNQILTKALTKILELGVASKCEDTGALCNRRMIRDEAIRRTRKICGSLGGNPNLVNQNSTKHQPNVQANSNPFRAEDESEVEDKVKQIQKEEVPNKDARALMPGIPRNFQDFKEPTTKANQADVDRAAKVMALYPNRSKAGRRVEGFTFTSQNLLAIKIAAAPEFPWEEACRLEQGTEYPRDFSRWLDNQPDLVALEAKRKGSAPIYGGPKKAKEIKL